MNRMRKECETHRQGVPVAGFKLTLRTALSTSELADHVAHMVWDCMTRQPDAHRLDAHRFPGLSHAVDAVLLRHLGACLVDMGSPPYDVWARTGGERKAGSDKRAACRDHTRRLLAETGGELQLLLTDLENEISQFLFRHQSAREKFNHGFSECVHRAVTESIAPYLYQNLAASCCLELAS